MNFFMPLIQQRLQIASALPDMGKPIRALKRDYLSTYAAGLMLVLAATAPGAQLKPASPVDAQAVVGASQAIESRLAEARTNLAIALALLTRQ